MSVRRIMLYLPTLVLCKLTVAHQRGLTISPRDVRTLFAVAHGFFARMLPWLPTGELFDEITALLDLALKPAQQCIDS